MTGQATGGTTSRWTRAVRAYTEVAAPETEAGVLTQREQFAALHDAITGSLTQLSDGQSMLLSTVVTPTRLTTTAFVDGHQPPAHDPLASLVGWTPWSPARPPDLAEATAMPHWFEVTPSTFGVAEPAGWPAASPWWTKVVADLTAGSHRCVVAVRATAVRASQATVWAANAALEAAATGATGASGATRVTRAARVTGEPFTGADFVVHMWVGAADAEDVRRVVARLSAASALVGGGRLEPRAVAASPSAAANPARGGLVSSALAGRLVPARTAAVLMPLPAVVTGSPVQAPRRAASSATYASPVDGARIVLGAADSGAAVHVGIDELAQHALVTGVSGYGKSSTIRSITGQLWRDHDIPFLVIDSEKNEYAALHASASGDRIRHVVLGRRGAPFNPLAVPPGVDPHEHAELIAELLCDLTDLNESFPLAAAVLTTLIREMYTWHGVEDPDHGMAAAPSFATLSSYVKAVGRSNDFAADTRAHIVESLRARIEAASGGMLAWAVGGGAASALDWEALLAEPTLVSFADISSEKARRLVYALLLGSLVEYRRANPARPLGPDQRLGHVLVLEEAHLAISRSPRLASTVATAVATQRSLGQGWVVVTQTTTQLGTDLAELFPTRITHRLPSGAAAAEGADALGVPVDELAVLDKGEAVLVRAGATHPVRLHVERRYVGDEPQHREPPHRSSEVLAALAPERSWCVRCPLPCRGKRWLDLTNPVMRSEVEHRLAHGAGDPRTQAARIVGLAQQAISTSIRTGDNLPPARLVAGTYCLSARVAARVNAADETEHLRVNAHVAALVRDIGTGMDRQAAARRQTAPTTTEGERP